MEIDGKLCLILLYIGWKGRDIARRVCLDFLLVVISYLARLVWQKECGLVGTKTFCCLYFWMLSLAMFVMAMFVMYGETLTFLLPILGRLQMGQQRH